MRALLKLAYDGRDLSGCPEIPGRRTVCGEVRAALARAGLDVDLETLSRTDAGVHALGQVASLRADRERDAPWLLRALDRHLPPDLRCTAAACLPDDAVVPGVTGKAYRYVLDASPFGDPFLAGRAWRVRVPWPRLEPLAPLLVGTHDFRAFRRRGETRDDLRRAVTAASWARHGLRHELTIAGAGFTYRLVRSLVGAMVAVARGDAEPDVLVATLAGEPSHLAGQQAPARGLVLEAVTLDPSPRWVTTLREPPC